MDYFSEILVPHVRPWCEKIDVRLMKRGYNPAGQGKVEIFIKPMIKRSSFNTFEDFMTEIKSKLKPFDLTSQGKLQIVRGISHASKSLEEARVADRQSHSAQQTLANLGTDVRIRSEYSDSASPGSGITIWAIFSKSQDDIDIQAPIRIGADCLGKKGLPADTVGKQAAERLLKGIESRAPVDLHLADNLVPFLALAGGEMKVQKLTQHLTTNVDVVKKIIGTEFFIDETDNRIKTGQ